MTLKEFSKDFFVEEKCPICIRKASRNNGFSKSTIRKYKTSLKLVHKGLRSIFHLQDY